jgi:hypothetical protein
MDWKRWPFTRKATDVPVDGELDEVYRDGESYVRGESLLAEYARQEGITRAGPGMYYISKLSHEGPGEGTYKYDFGGDDWPGSKEGHYPGE